MAMPGRIRGELEITKLRRVSCLVCLYIYSAPTPAANLHRIRDPTVPHYIYSSSTTAVSYQPKQREQRANSTRSILEMYP